MSDASLPYWTIQQLGARVEQALQSEYAGAPNGRVRDVPDLRTIRYYTTLGLLDRPAKMRGRTALYSRRHLLQLVAIKKLQANGLSLAEIQARLAGATDGMLGQIAGEAVVGPANDQLPAGAPRTNPTQPFWKSRPARVPARSPRQASSEVAHGTLNESPDRVALDDELGPLQAIALARGVTLLLPLDRPLAGGELRAIRRAAAPLIEQLTKHQLIQTPPKGEGYDPTASPVD
jgi:DNA-binding transcriptional MerR regulator